MLLKLKRGSPKYILIEINLKKGVSQNIIYLTKKRRGSGNPRFPDKEGFGKPQGDFKPQGDG
jgi:hypothetical protein